VVEVGSPLQIEVVGSHVRGRRWRLSWKPDTQLDAQGAGDRPCDLILHGEYLAHSAFVGLRPDPQPVRDIDELRGDPQPVAGTPGAAFEHGGGIQLAPDFP